jgi:short subunit dehydrogenase-like uncharacterized protein
VSQAGPICVYGATGFTGRLVAAELARRGADFVLSGRSASKLRTLASELGGEAPTHTASLDSPASLRSLLDGCAAVIDCAGPFTQLGEPVLAAAVETGTHYLDTTGEQVYMKKVFDRYGGAAEKAGVALVPAMGFDYVPGDLIASLTAEEMGPLDEIVLAYSVRGFGATQGTMLSALEILRGGDVEYRDGDWRPASQRIARGSFDFPQPIGEQPMVRYPAGEQITVPRHVETKAVRTLLSAKTAAPHPLLARTLPVTMGVVQVGMRTPLKSLVGRLITRLPEGPSEEDRRASRFTIVCEAVAGSRRRRGVIRGPDPYGLTAFTVVLGAVLVSEHGYERSGALAPSQAFDPSRFVENLADFGVEHELDPLPRESTTAAAAR